MCIRDSVWRGAKRPIRKRAIFMWWWVLLYIPPSPLSSFFGNFQILNVPNVWRQFGGLFSLWFLILVFIVLIAAATPPVYRERTVETMYTLLNYCGQFVLFLLYFLFFLNFFRKKTFVIHNSFIYVANNTKFITLIHIDLPQLLLCWRYCSRHRLPTASSTLATRKQVCCQATHQPAHIKHCKHHVIVCCDAWKQANKWNFIFKTFYYC